MENLFIRRFMMDRIIKDGYQIYENEHVFICHPSIRYSYDEINVIKQFMEVFI